MSNVKWQLQVKQSNVTDHDCIHPKSKYHAYVEGNSVCGKYGQSDFFETEIEESELMANKQVACKKCLKKLNLE